MKITACLGKKTKVFQEHTPLSTTRWAAIGLPSLALSANSSTGISLAEDNGYWLIGPIPIPPIYNKIANEEMGTRSFVKNEIYMANIGTKGSVYRLRKYAFDLLALGDLIGQDAWNYVMKYLRLKSTFMYYDFDKIISAASGNDKQPLLDLANKLFDSVEKLEDAVKKHELPETESCYQTLQLFSKKSGIEWRKFAESVVVGQNSIKSFELQEFVLLCFALFVL